LLSKVDYKGAQWLASPNFNVRAGKVRHLILHYTGMENEAVALARLQDEQAEVSAHYVVNESGHIFQMVAESARAWHAGKSCWQDDNDLNSSSIGIEIVNAGPMANFPNYPEIQIQSVIHLCQNILTRYKIAPRHVLAHSDIAPTRKIDPGEKFPWTQLAAADIGHYVMPTPIQAGHSLFMGMCGADIIAYQQDLACYGYVLPINGKFDELTQSVTCAFQRHFRPCLVDGIADISTRQTLKNLVRAL